MSIKLITGKPGSGKSYYAVHKLVLTSFYFVPETKSYKIRDGYCVVSNIDSLKLPHLNLSELMGDLPVKVFFSVPHQKTLAEKYGSIIYFIDEAQNFFHKKFYERDVFYYFEYHRHLGADIYLITQSSKLLPASILELVECEIRAQSRSVSFVGELKYVHLVQGEVCDRSILRPKKDIFNLYTSQDLVETEKNKNPFFKYVLAMIIFLVASVGFFQWHFKSKYFGAKPAQASVVASPVKVSPVPVKKQTPVVGSSEAVSLNQSAVDPVRVRLSYMQTSSGIVYLHPEKSGVVFRDNNSPYTIEKYGSEHFAVIHNPVPVPDLLRANPDQVPGVVNKDKIIVDNEISKE